MKKTRKFAAWLLVVSMLLTMVFPTMVIGSANTTGKMESSDVSTDEGELATGDTGIVKKEPTATPIPTTTTAPTAIIKVTPEATRVPKVTEKPALKGVKPAGLGEARMVPFAVPTDRSKESGVNFDIRNMSVGAGTVDDPRQNIIVNGSWVWNSEDKLLAKEGRTFNLEAIWSAASTLGWEAGDYLIFDLPMGDIIGYASETGPLNSGYGTWSVYRVDADGNVLPGLGEEGYNASAYRAGFGKVKFTLSETAVEGNSLDNGTFKTEASVKNFGTNGAEGTTEVDDKVIHWKAPDLELSDEPPYNAEKDMYKGVMGREEGRVGQFYFRVNATTYKNWFENKANNLTGGAALPVLQKNNMVIVDELPEELELTGLTALEMMLRGPLERESGYIVQGSYQTLTIDIKNQPGVTIVQTPGQSYSDFYDAVVEDGTAPCWGAYTDENTGRSTIVIKLGDLPSNNETFVDIQNRLFGTGYSSTKEWLEANLPGGGALTKPERVALWLDKAGAIYTNNNDLYMWDYLISFYTKAKWTAEDLDASKTIENKATLTWGDDGSNSDSSSMLFRRTDAYIEVSPGELYLVKTDSETKEAIPGVSIDIYEYAGSAITLAGVRADSNVANWVKKTNPALVTKVDGSVRYQGNISRFYKVVEVQTADGYDINSFEVFSADGNTIYEGGIFEMPATTGVKIIARNTKKVPDPTSIALKASKVLTGRNLAAEEFEFELYEGLTLLKTAKNDASGNVTFDSITYTAAGDHEYTIKEKSGSLPGIDYDLAEFTVTVKVTDNAGALSAVATYPSSGAIFRNKYIPDSTSVSITASKVLTGRDLAAEEFEFELYEGLTLLKTAKNDASGNITFDSITYTAAGDHEYTIKEKSGSLPGIDYDLAEFTVTVKVTDNAGVLSAVATYPAGGTVFRNTYIPDSTSVSIKASKVLTGRDLAAEEFEFELYEGLTLLKTAKNDASGNITFDSITYTAAGDHEYTIKEKSGSLPGVGYDATIFTVTVEVTDEGGALKAEVKYPVGGTIFENKYIPDSANIILNASKVLTGRDLSTGEFNFEVYENGNKVSEGTNAADGSITFDSITYTAEGNHTYTIKEVSGALGGVSYDGREFTVTVKVTDEGGALKAEATYPTGGVVFENEYEITGDVRAKIEGTKTLIGRALKADEFEFELYEGTNLIQTVANDADGKIAFDEITYDAIGIHEYTVKEKAGLLGGVTYDKKVFAATVTVTDNGIGGLKAEVTYPEAIDFENYYTTNGDVVAKIVAKKQLEGRDLRASEFAFGVYDEDEIEVSSGTNDADGNIAFTGIVYDSIGTHKYTVKEKAGSLGGVLYDQHSYEVNIAIEDNGDGKLKATVTYPEEEGITFKNFYEANGAVEAVIEGNKVLTGRDLASGEFGFELYEGETLLREATNDANGKIIFDELGYTAAGIHTYTIKEVNGDLGGVTYDDAIFTVTVTITDNGEGGWDADVTYPEGGVVFENEYTTTETSVVLEASKELHGRDLKAEEFTFKVYDESGIVVSSGKNDSNGKVVFTSITYDTVGVYKYTVKEETGDLGGILYDAKVFEVTVTVIDDGQGALVATTGYSEDVVFENYYATNGEAFIQLEGTKKLNGRDLKAKEFTFKVYDKDNKEVSTGSHDKDGKIVFDVMKYDKAGTYEYTVKEVQGEAEGITYDKTVLKVTVEVIDNGDGTLTAKVVEEKSDKISFTNTYKPTPTPVPTKTPTVTPKPTTKTLSPSAAKTYSSAKTGDTNAIMSWFALLAIATLVGIGAIVVRKKRRVTK